MRKKKMIKIRTYVNEKENRIVEEVIQENSSFAEKTNKVILLQKKAQIIHVRNEKGIPLHILQTMKE